MYACEHACLRASNGQGQQSAAYIDQRSSPCDSRVLGSEAPSHTTRSPSPFDLPLGMLASTWCPCDARAAPAAGCHTEREIEWEMCTSRASRACMAMEQRCRLEARACMSRWSREKAHSQADAGSDEESFVTLRLHTGVAEITDTDETLITDVQGRGETSCA